MADPHAPAAYEAALDAVETATRALPADGSIKGPEYDELLQELVRLRGAIVDGADASRFLVPTTKSRAWARGRRRRSG